VVSGWNEARRSMMFPTFTAVVATVRCSSASQLFVMNVTAATWCRDHGADRVPPVYYHYQPAWSPNENAPMRGGGDPVRYPTAPENLTNTGSDMALAWSRTGRRSPGAIGRATLTST